MPEEVLRFRENLQQDKSHDLYAVGMKLTANTATDEALRKMWWSIKVRSQEDDPWVSSFVQSCRKATDLPRYYYHGATERDALCRRLKRLASELTRLLREHELDAQVVHSNGENFGGFFFYEDFSDLNQSIIDDQNTRRLRVTDLIGQIANRSVQELEKVRPAKRVSKNVKAVRFVRIIVQLNRHHYGSPLLEVTATAANTLFGTSYDQARISNLIDR
jgi:hypothetical protein